MVLGSPSARRPHRLSSFLVLCVRQMASMRPGPDHQASRTYGLGVEDPAPWQPGRALGHIFYTRQNFVPPFEDAPLWSWRTGYRQVMPRISAFYGIVIYMYWNEKDHPVAHFHAYHAGRRASVSMDGEVLAGVLSPEHCSSFGSGPICVRMRSWRTGNEPAGTSHCTVSTRCRSMGT